MTYRLSLAARAAGLSRVRGRRGAAYCGPLTSCSLDLGHDHDKYQCLLRGP
jgi:hypothetical protein